MMKILARLNKSDIRVLHVDDKSVLLPGTKIFWDEIIEPITRHGHVVRKTLSGFISEIEEHQSQLIYHVISEQF
jgi:hypothetical protein